MLQTHIDTLLQRTAEGQRLSPEEGLLLYREASLNDLGIAANAARQVRVPGNVVTYLVDRNINYTNVCTTNCSFCGFYRPLGHPEAYVQTYQEIGVRVAELVSVGGTRILMQGGHHPELKLDYYTGLLRHLTEHYPSIEIDAFSPSEIENFAAVWGMDVRQVLEELKAAGLSGLPGGGGEMLVDDIRARVSPLKQRADGWINIMRIAQELKLATSATNVIGFGETLEQRMEHFMRLRDLTDESLAKGADTFTAFIAWPVQHSEMTSLGRSRLKEQFGATAVEYLRHMAVARIMLDNIAHMQASWVTMGPKIGQASLHYGIDDMGSTMLEENVVSQASNDTYMAMSERDLHALIRAAGYTPAKRDTRYHTLKVFEQAEELPELPRKTRRTVEIIPLAAS